MHNGCHLDRELYPLRADAVRVHHIRYAALQWGCACRLLLRVARWSDHAFHAGNNVSLQRSRRSLSELLFSFRILFRCCSCVCLIIIIKLAQPVTAMLQNYNIHAKRRTNFVRIISCYKMAGNKNTSHLDKASLVTFLV